MSIFIYQGQQFKLENGVLFSRFSSVRQWVESSLDFWTVTQHGVKVTA